MKHKQIFLTLGLLSVFVLTVSAQPSETIEEIIVTGELIERSLQDNHSSIAVMTGKQLRDMNADDLEDVLAFTAGVARSGQTTNVGGGGLVIRGVRDVGVSRSGAGKTLTISVDGVRYSNLELSTASVLSTWDLQQIEILRGPQSTQAGRNALAGAVVARSNAPSDITENRFRIGYGTANALQAAIMSNLPLADTLAFRVAAEHRQNDGFSDNPTLAIDDYDAHQKTNIRMALKWQPNDEFSALLRYTWMDWQEPLVANKVLLESFPANRLIDFDDRERFDRDIRALNLRLSYQLNEALTIESETSRLSSKFEAIFDNDQGPVTLLQNFGNGESTSFEQDLRLRYETEKLRAVLGAYYTKIDEDDIFSGGLFDLRTGFPPQPVTNIDSAPPPNVLAVTENDGLVEIINSAVYGELEYQLSDAVRLIVGARYDREELDNQTTFVGKILSSGQVLVSTEDPIAADYNAFLPKASVVYQINDDVSTALTIQRGYRAGGGDFTIFGVLVGYDPEYITNYEWSIRSESMEGRLIANANLFYTDWTDQQVSIPRPGGIGAQDRIIANVGSSELIGGEIEIKARPSEQLSINASLGYVDTEFTDFGPGEASLIGNQFPYAAEWTAALGGRYEFGNGVYAALDMNYTSDSFSNVGNIEADRISSRFIMDSRVGYETEGWHLFLYIHNLADRDYIIDTSVVNSGLRQANNPREVGLVLEMPF